MKTTPSLTTARLTTARLTTAATLALAMSGAAFGLHAADITETAKVVSATPILEKITDISSDCGREQYYRPTARAPEQERSLMGPIIGGIAGAILGKQVGQGNGNVIATAGGAIAGAVIGDHVGNRQSATPPPPQYVEQPCRRIETTRDVVKGYTVVYRFNGRDVITTMPYNPGPQVTVGVSAIPDAR